MQRYIIFDFDGVLVDSREYVRDAYVLAGCSPPDDVLAQRPGEWHQHSCTHDLDEDTLRKIYSEKDVAYIQRLHDEPELEWLAGMYAAYSIWRETPDQHLGVYSAAPCGSLRVVRHRWGWVNWPFKFAIDGTRTTQKMRMIHSLRHDWDFGGVYVDDQDRGIELPDDWRFVHYTDQDVRTLVEEVMHE